MINLADVITEFRRPFTPAAVKYKIQTNPKKYDNGNWGKALIVTYMDSRLVAERLNAVCPGDWHDEYEPLFRVSQSGSAGVVCRLSVLGSSRSDVGYEKNPDTDMGLKGLYSDAFKRAAVKFGIGAYLYALPKAYLDVGKLKQSGNSWYIQREGDQELLRQYTQWLSLPATLDRFGAPLDHGDHEDAQGETVEAPPEPLVPEAVIEEVLSDATDAVTAGVKVRDIFSALEVEPQAGLKSTLRTMTPEQIEAFRVRLVDEAKAKLGATEVKA